MYTEAYLVQGYSRIGNDYRDIDSDLEEESVVYRENGSDNDDTILANVVAIDYNTNIFEGTGPATNVKANKKLAGMFKEEESGK